MNPSRHFGVLLLVLSGPGFILAAPTDSFDAPVDKKVLDLGPSPYSLGGNIHIHLSCYVYPTFIVKEYDEGQKGAEWLAIAQIGKGAVPQCSKSHAEGEWVIGQKEWDGYFLGVTVNLIFLVAADGTDGGMPFVIFDAKTRKKIFEDSFFYRSMWNEQFEDSPFNDMRIERIADGKIVLKYLRVTGTLCDLHPAQVSCWEPTRKKLGIKNIQKPVCINYEDIHVWYVSAVAYPVEVSLSPKPVRKNIDGPVRCWPVD